MCCMFVFFFFKQKTAYEMRISDWSSDVCSSDLAGDDELLALGALRLDPGRSPPRAVGRVALLGHHASEAQPAGMAQHQLAVLLEVLAVAQRPLRVAQQRGKRRLALDQRARAQVAAVEVEQVEEVEHHAVAAAGGEVRLQGGEVGGAAV